MASIEVERNPMTGAEKLREFMIKDSNRLAEIVEEHPFQIPVKALAQWWHCSEDSIRNAIIQHGFLGIAQKQPGKVNAGFVIPTGHFVRWWCCQFGIQ